MDRLEFLRNALKLQSELQDKIGARLDILTYEEKEKWSKENVLAMQAEIIEFISWMNWKHWKKTKVDYDKERIREIRLEIIDIFHFWMNLCIIWGMDAEMIEDYYITKQKINMKRQEDGY